MNQQLKKMIPVGMLVACSSVFAPVSQATEVTGATFVVIYKKPENKATASETIKFFDFGFKDGKQMASDLDYVPMPDATTNYIRKSVWSQVDLK